MVGHYSPTINRKSARRAIERVSEVQSGLVDLSRSAVGYCSDRSHANYGRVTAFLPVDNTSVEYTGYVDDVMSRKKVPLGSGDMESARHAFIQRARKHGYSDICDGLFASWDPCYRGRLDTVDDEELMMPLYRGSKCSAKKRKACKSKKSKKTCSWRKGTTTKKGVKRKGTCTKKKKSKSGKKKKTKSGKKKKTKSGKKKKTMSGKKKMTKKKSCKSKKRLQCKKSGCSWRKGSYIRPDHGPTSTGRKWKKGTCMKGSKVVKSKCNMKKKKGSCKKPCSWVKGKYLSSGKWRKGFCRK